jgi:DNA invertase Pin-like site-specific DNA recombinase
MGYSINDIKLKVTYYSRVSTDHLEQQNSLTNQTTYFEKMIKNNKNWTYIPGYIEKGISGTTDYKREQFLNMINDAKNNKFDLIITKEISRFSRNTLDSIKYTRELLSYGVFVLFLNDNINTILPDSELRLTIMASMAQDEIRRLSERVKFGMNRSIESGNILGNNKLYGYKKYKDKLKINKQEAIIVKRLFNLYVIENYSLSKISKLFNKENIKTNYGKKWTIQTLSRMIKNPKYKGYYCGKKTEVIDFINKKIKYLPKDQWITYKDYIKIPAIIDEEL